MADIMDNAFSRRQFIEDIHIGFSGHASPAVMMEMIQRDSRGMLEGMVVAINANDPLHFCHRNIEDGKKL